MKQKTPRWKALKAWFSFKSKIAGLTGTVRTPAEITRDLEAPARAAEQQRRDQEFEAAAPKVLPYASSKIDKLLMGFIAADAQALALQYAQLVKEFEEARGYGQHADAQEQLCVAADAIGSLRFPDDWSNAKATTELAQVA